MARNRRSAFDGLAVLPWPAGLAAGIVGYVVIRHGLPAWLPGRGPLAEALLVQSGLLTALAWAVLGLCILAAITSYFRARHRRRLLDTCTNSSASPPWAGAISNAWWARPTAATATVSRKPVWAAPTAVACWCSASNGAAGGCR